MTVFQLYLLFALGIILSILLPIARRWIAEATSSIESRGAADIMKRVLGFALPYLKVAAGSAVVGFVLLLVFFQSGGKAEDITWFNAVLYGYAWDSTLQKLTQK